MPVKQKLVPAGYERNLMVRVEPASQRFSRDHPCKPAADNYYVCHYATDVFGALSLQRTTSTEHFACETTAFETEPSKNLSQAR